MQGIFYDFYLHYILDYKFKDENLYFYYNIGRTTNDGNTARRFFKNAEINFAVTNLDLQLIKQFGIILKIMSSGYDINLEKFEAYTLKTAELCSIVLLYSWYYYIPASVHKILIHSTDIIRSALLPIG